MTDGERVSVLVRKSAADGAGGGASCILCRRSHPRTPAASNATSVYGLPNCFHAFTSNMTIATCFRGAVNRRGLIGRPDRYRSLRPWSNFAFPADKLLGNYRARIAIINGSGPPPAPIFSQELGSKHACGAAGEVQDHPATADALLHRRNVLFLLQLSCTVKTEPFYDELTREGAEFAPQLDRVDQTLEGKSQRKCASSERTGSQAVPALSQERWCTVWGQQLAETSFTDYDKGLAEGHPPQRRAALADHDVGRRVRRTGIEYLSGQKHDLATGGRVDLGGLLRDVQRAPSVPDDHQSYPTASARQPFDRATGRQQPFKLSSGTSRQIIATMISSG